MGIWKKYNMDRYVNVFQTLDGDEKDDFDGDCVYLDGDSEEDYDYRMRSKKKRRQHHPRFEKPSRKPHATFGAYAKS